MEAAAFVAIALTVITAATPVVFAALGELMIEKSGVLNLGVEGMMLIGAISGFAIATSFDSAVGGFLASVAAGIAIVFGICLHHPDLTSKPGCNRPRAHFIWNGASGPVRTDFVGQPFPGIEISDPAALGHSDHRPTTVRT